MESLTGFFRLQYCFDVSEAIDLEQLRQILRVDRPARDAAARHQAPGMVRFERPPIVERLPALKLASGEHFPTRARYFDYGVVSLELELPFEGVDWSQLIALSSRWVATAEVESVAEAAVRAHLRTIAPSLRKPADRLLSEDYTVIEITRASTEDGLAINAPQLLERYGQQIAQVVRGELSPLSLPEQQEVLASSMSYSPSDLVVVGWTAAMVYDPDPESADLMRQLLEYANTQLLEFRHYDEVLNSVLVRVYGMLDKQPGVLQRWRMARQAGKLNTIRLDVIELSERTDNAIKFLSDMYYARAYKLAAARIGVPDYRALVDDKLRTAGELYRFLMDEFHQGRAFVLELMIVIILIIDLYYLFKGNAP
jgi:hypothetical protein